MPLIAISIQRPQPRDLARGTAAALLVTMNSVDCQDCDHPMPDDPLPDVNDDEAWEREAHHHELHCYALLTRGRQRPNPCAHVPGVYYMGRRRWLALEIPRPGA